MEVYQRLALQVMGEVAGVVAVAEQPEVGAVEQTKVGVGAVIMVREVLGKVQLELRNVYRIFDIMQLPYHTLDRTAYILIEAVKNYKVFLFIFYNKKHEDGIAMVSRLIMPRRAYLIPPIAGSSFSRHGTRETAGARR